MRDNVQVCSFLAVGALIEGPLNVIELCRAIRQSFAEAYPDDDYVPLVDVRCGISHSVNSGAVTARTVDGVVVYLLS